MLQRERVSCPSVSSVFFSNFALTAPIKSINSPSQLIQKEFIFPQELRVTAAFFYSIAAWKAIDKSSPCTHIFKKHPRLLLLIHEFEELKVRFEKED